MYSFGVMLWEMYCGERAWAGLNTAQVRLFYTLKLKTPEPLTLNMANIRLCLRMPHRLLAYILPGPLDLSARYSSLCACLMNCQRPYCQDLGIPQHTRPL